MSASSQWFRLSIDWDQSDWLAELDWPVRAVWPIILAHVKANGVGGVCKSLIPKRLAAFHDIPVECITVLLSEAQKHNAVIIREGELIVVKWDKYQPRDATQAKRQREHRERQRVQALAEIPEQNEEQPEHNGVMGRDVTAVTHRDSNNNNHNHGNNHENSTPKRGEARNLMPIELAEHLIQESPEEWRTQGYREVATAMIEMQHRKHRTSAWDSIQITQNVRSWITGEFTAEQIMAAMTEATNAGYLLVKPRKAVPHRKHDDPQPKIYNKAELAALRAQREQNEF